MPNYNDAQGVADLLSQFDFNIISEGPGDFSTQHRKYTCEFSKPGIESFTTTYQSNPDVHGQPTATDVFAALASDALAVDGRHIDDFADEMGFEKPSQAIRAYESCRKTLDWLKNDMQLMTSEISDIAETLDNELDEVKEEVERVQAERKAKHEFEHPPVPEGFTSIEDLQASLNQGVPGDLLRPAMEKARAEYEKVKAHQSPEKAVSLKGEVETARGASAAMADNGNHSNRGQDAR